MVGYYDAVLALIPVTLLGLGGGLYTLGLTLSPAVILAATVAAGLIGHAMFVRAPIDSPTEARSRAEPAVDVAAD